MPSFPLKTRKLSVVMPVYNEMRSIEQILRQVQEAPYDKEIVIVDDASTDGTRKWLEAILGLQALGNTEAGILENTAKLHVGNLRIFLQDQNQGKGAALRRGFDEARGEVILVQDADLEYDPNDYPKLLEPILAGRADVVFGSRYLGGNRPVQEFLPYVANRFLTYLSNALTGLKLTDMETCYKAFRREVLQGIRLQADRFDFEPEVTAKIARGKWRVIEVPIHYAARTEAEGKKISWRDGVHAVWCILRYNLLP